MKMPVFALLADGAALSGCASIKPAQMALPAPLVAAEPVTISGIGAGRSGSFGVGDGDEGGSFQRGRDFLSLFDVVSFDRAATRYEFQGAGGQPTKAACVGRQATLTLGIVTGQPTPYTLRCEWSGEHNAQMTLEAPSWMPGTKAERRGNFISGSLTLELRSVH